MLVSNPVCSLLTITTVETDRTILAHEQKLSIRIYSAIILVPYLYGR